ncbi:MAG: NYN domain-containing protein [Planctomycetes bacterium]|nr:NYN domain-containing protein [Planctomycetota bacterium]
MDKAIWIVDGNNLIRRDPEYSRMLHRGSWEAASRALEGDLARFRRAQGRGHSVVVVYDGVEGPDSRDRSTKGLRILRAGDRTDADRLVLSEVQRHEGRTEVHVVTSDRQDIGSRLRGLRVIWHTVEEFVGELRRGRTRRQRATERLAPEEPEEKPSAPSGHEIDHWLEIFGGSGTGDDDGSGES